MQTFKSLIAVIAIAPVLVIAQPTPQLVSRAKAAIAEQLKDPYSAVYSDLRTRRSEGRTVLCGQVNAKNSFGGYIGKRPFAFVDHPSGASAIIDSPIVDVLCASPEEQALRKAAAARAKAEEARAKAEEAGALCGPETTLASPGECGRLYAECTLEAKDFEEPARVSFMKSCRRKGVAYAKQEWEASLGELREKWPSPTR